MIAVNNRYRMCLGGLIFDITCIELIGIIKYNRKVSHGKRWTLPRSLLNSNLINQGKIAETASIRPYSKLFQSNQTEDVGSRTVVKPKKANAENGKSAQKCVTDESIISGE